MDFLKDKFLNSLKLQIKKDLQIAPTLGDSSECNDQNQTISL